MFLESQKSIDKNVTEGISEEAVTKNFPKVIKYIYP